jgi:hypothetical protein
VDLNLKLLLSVFNVSVDQMTRIGFLAETFFLCYTPIPAVGPIHPFMQWVLEAVFDFGFKLEVQFSVSV